MIDFVGSQYPTLSVGWSPGEQPSAGGCFLHAVADVGVTEQHKRMSYQIFERLHGFEEAQPSIISFDFQERIRIGTKVEEDSQRS